jgi:hypothetical protein
MRSGPAVALAPDRRVTFFAGHPMHPKENLAMVDTYTVATRMILEDRGMVAGLRNIARLAKETEQALKGMRDGTRNLFSAALVARVNSFADGMRRAQSELRYFGQATSASSGVERLTNQLRQANEQASRLARTLSHTRGPTGGNGGVGGGGHGRHGGILNHGFMQSMYDADMIAGFVASAFKPAMELGHQRALAMVMGENPAQTQAMESAAFRTARAVPQISAGSLFKIERELLPVVAAGTPNGEDPLNRMIEHLGDAAKTNALLENYLGDEKSGGGGKRMSQYYNALRSGELLGLGQDPKKLKAWTDMATQAVIASGGRLDMNQVRQFVTTAGSAAIAMSPEFILRNLSELMVEQGGSKVGTMAATFMQSGAGRMTQMASRENIALGLLDPSKISFPAHSGGRPVLGDNAWTDEYDRFNNPGKWAIHDMAPAIMKKLGVNMSGMSDEQIANRMSAANLSELEKVGITKELAHLFSDRNAQKFAEQLMLHSTAMTRFAGRMDRANPNFRMQSDTDPTMAWAGVKGAWETLRASALAGPLTQLLPIINAVSDTMTTIAAIFKDHPVLAADAMKAGGGALALGGVGAGYSMVSFLRAGPALMGAAASLESAAVSLKVGAAGGAAGGLGGGAAAGAGAGAAARWGLRGVLARAMPWTAAADVLFGGWIGGGTIQPEEDQEAFSKYFAKNSMSADAWAAASKQGMSGRTLGGRDIGIGAPSWTGDASPGWTIGGRSFQSMDDSMSNQLADPDANTAGASIGTAAADVITQAVANFAAAVANLNGDVTLSGPVNLDGVALGNYIAKGLAHATGGAGGASSVPTTPGFAGGLTLPGPI